MPWPTSPALSSSRPGDGQLETSIVQLPDEPEPLDVVVVVPGHSAIHAVLPAPAPVTTVDGDPFSAHDLILACAPGRPLTRRSQVGNITFTSGSYRRSRG